MCYKFLQIYIYWLLVFLQNIECFIVGKIMIDIQNQLRKNLAKKNMLSQWIGSYALEIINNFFGTKNITGYIRHNKLFLHRGNYDMTKIFLEKQKILETINQKLENLWTKIKITDIKILVQKFEKY